MPTSHQQIPIDKIVPNPSNLTDRFTGTEDDKCLIESIRLHGVLQEIVVVELADGTFRLVNGERRWRACQALGMVTIDAAVHRHLPDESDRILTENNARKGYTTWEGITALWDKLIEKRTRAESLGRKPPTVEQVGTSIGLKPSMAEVYATIANNISTKDHEAISQSPVLRQFIKISDLNSLRRIPEKDHPAFLRKLDAEYATMDKPHGRRRLSGKPSSNLKYVLRDKDGEALVTLKEVTDENRPVVAKNKPRITLLISKGPHHDDQSEEDRQELNAHALELLIELYTQIKTGRLQPEKPAPAPDLVIVPTSTYDALPPANEDLQPVH